MNYLISQACHKENQLSTTSLLSWEEFQEGRVLLIDKPYKWTSFDVVRKVKNLTKTKKIGHAGTLDPLATGLLILCTGKKTKEIDQYQAADKMYEGTLELGKTTPSVDLETEFDGEFPYEHVDEEKLADTAKNFKGWIKQIPPQFSAIKVQGERVYKKARKGENVIMPPRHVQIIDFHITNVNLPEVSFLVKCSKGTYIRSLVKDFGEALDTGAYLKALRRTQIGNWKVDDALTLEELKELINNRDL